MAINLQRTDIRQVIVTVDGDTGVTVLFHTALLLLTMHKLMFLRCNANGGYIDGVQQAEVTANAGETIYFDPDSSLSGHHSNLH